MVTHENPVVGSVYVKGWPKTIKKVRAIKALTMKQNLKDSFVEVDFFMTDSKGKEHFKVLWGYTVK